MYISRITKTELATGYAYDGAPVYTLNVWVHGANYSDMGKFLGTDDCTRYTFTNCKVKVNYLECKTYEQHVITPVLASCIYAISDYEPNIELHAVSSIAYEVMGDYGKSPARDDASGWQRSDFLGPAFIEKFFEDRRIGCRGRLEKVVDELAMHLTGLDVEDYEAAKAAGLRLENIIA